MAEAAPSQSRLYNALHLLSRARKQAVSSAFCHGVLALRAGQIDGQSQAKGIRIPLSGLLIGVSALELGYEVGTANVRHSQLIPGLNVVQP